MIKTEKLSTMWKGNEIVMNDETVIAILSELKKCYLGGIVDALDFAIEAVKMQEPIRPNKIRHGDVLMYYQCPACTSTLCAVDRYCSQCGRKVKWE